MTVHYQGLYYASECNEYSYQKRGYRDNARTFCYCKPLCKA
ncbi:hypothetical protein MVUOKPPV_CDS0275 [Klebsiella phage phi1_175008]|uniref:Uncharacterized protein n=1 Tax=Klebsiella phage phi1_175008 TaxID=3127744 RepID=A0ACD5FS39_9CAUD